MILFILGIVIFGVLLVLGTPIFIAMLCGGMWIFLVALQCPLAMIAQMLVSNIDVFSLMAIAPFVLAGNLMAHSGASRALVNMTEAFLGRVPGGLGIVAVLSCSVFAAMCGSTIATSAAIGSMLVQPMSEKGYPRSFSTALLATSGTLGIMIPPSINFIIYGGIVSASIPTLFMAGVVPGLLLMGILAALTVWYSKGKGISSDKSFSWQEKLLYFGRACPALGLIFVIMAPIYTGLCTPTESAAIAVVYAFLVGRFYYRKLTYSQLWVSLVSAAKTTAMLLIIISSGLLFGGALVAHGMAEMISNWIIRSGFTWWQFLIVVNIIWLLLGFLMESTSVLVIMVPLIIGLFKPLGISPIHFGVLCVLNTEIALITPPVGINLYVMSSVGKVPVESVVKGIWPFVIALLLGLIAITYIPQMSLFLPKALGLLE
ncbi:MAG: C4-dicarboxylate ABC transporter permease [Deltaproteobacteria bacterium]|nr:MAG: C4-dicarboxylate ABC transporter permease [Deltaproteobacteria bacterium]